MGLGVVQHGPASSPVVGQCGVGILFDGGKKNARKIKTHPNHCGTVAPAAFAMVDRLHLVDYIQKVFVTQVALALVPVWGVAGCRAQRGI